jgi:O-antigen biosynthesis protein WbqV
LETVDSLANGYRTRTLNSRKLTLNRWQVAFAHDLFMAATSFVLSLYLRMGDTLLDLPWTFVGQSAAIFTGICAMVFWPMGLYRGVWRYASINDVIQMTKAVTLVILIFLPMLFFVTRAEFLPRSLPIINWFVLLALLGGPRFAYRLFKDRHLDLTLSPTVTAQVPVLLVGAGDEAETFIREMSRQPGSEYRIVGILDEKGRRVGRDIRGISVLGTIDDFEPVMRRLALRVSKPQRLIVTKPNLDPDLLGRLLDLADRHGMTLSRLPRLTEFRRGLADRIEVRPIDVEDLLGRPQAVLDRPAMRQLIGGRRVLVTGAGGTIGSELVRQLATLAPARLTLIDNSEFNLYTIDQELGREHPDLPRDVRLADIRDRAHLGAIIGESRPQLVFHAAALKHVHLVEANPTEGVLTNIVGSRNVADLCREHGVEAMVQVSTDKAVNPTGVMGVTKRAAEAYSQSLDVADAGARAGSVPTRYVTVRFGNVLGSTGSVVPLFQQQIARGGPVTVTHREVSRYFMTTREAVELILQASVLGTRDDSASGRIFVLDMGTPVKIVDLAEKMVRLAGKRPYDDIDIVFTGLRPGEKLHEELFHYGEATTATDNEAIHLAAPRIADHQVLARAIDELQRAAATGDDSRCRAILQRIVPEYTPTDAPPDEAANAAAK